MSFPLETKKRKVCLRENWKIRACRYDMGGCAQVWEAVLAAAALEVPASQAAASWRPGIQLLWFKAEHVSQLKACLSFLRIVAANKVLQSRKVARLSCTINNLTSPLDFYCYLYPV